MTSAITLKTPPKTGSSLARVAAAVAVCANEEEGAWCCDNLRSAAEWFEAGKAESASGMFESRMLLSIRAAERSCRAMLA